MSKKVLLTFVGSRDAGSPSEIDGVMEPGAVMKVFDDQQPDTVYLFHNRNNDQFREIAVGIRGVITDKAPETSVEIVELMIADPQNHLGILNQLREEFKGINDAHPDSSFLINLTSGTPAMHACWLLLAASGEIPAARVFSAKETKYLKEGDRPVREVDLTNPQFPQIKPFKALPDFESDEDYGQIARDCGLIGVDPVFLRVIEQVFALAKTDFAILLRGDRGTGKELFAKMIHQLSARSNRVYNPINAGAHSDQIVESELFGHEKGAFTGAVQHRKGAFEASNDGTIFLDEIGTLPISTQNKLLRTIQNGTIQKVGRDVETKVDVRIVAATNIDLNEACRNGSFKEDLRDRFLGEVELPTLLQRRKDIPVLTQHFIAKWNDQHSETRRFSSESLKKLMTHSWPGNVRELEQLINRTLVMNRNAVIKPDQIDFKHDATGRSVRIPEPEGDFKLNIHVQQHRRTIIERAIELEGGRIVGKKLEGCTKASVARRLGISDQAVDQELKKQ
jgi:DNA-binding NtrC family response regulator